MHKVQETRLKESKGKIKIYSLSLHIQLPLLTFHYSEKQTFLKTNIISLPGTSSRHCSPRQPGHMSPLHSLPVLFVFIQAL